MQKAQEALEPSALSGSFRSNRALALGLLALIAGLGLYIWMSDWAHEEVRDGFLLGGFPLFAVAMMALPLLIMVCDGKAKASTEGMIDLRWRHIFAVVTAVAFLGLSFWLISVIGFVPAVFVLVAGGALLLQFRPVWLPLVLGLGTAILLRVLLLALDVRIKDGPLATLVGG